MQSSSTRALSGSVAIITGAESGIGEACALALADAGADIALCFFTDHEAASSVATLARQRGASVEAVACDVRDEASIEHAFDLATRALKRPNVLINSAGLNMSGVALADMSLEQWRRVVETDLSGAFLTCRRFIRDLRRDGVRGRIVNIASIHAEVPRARGADYDAAKGGLLNLTRTLALECAPHGITVNAVAPGMILTPMNGRAEEDSAFRARLEANIPLGRAGKAEEGAALVRYLVSPDASYITGASLTIDGGLSLVLGQGA